jgi:adenine-specific DNA-methyltransferase
MQFSELRMYYYSVHNKTISNYVHVMKYMGSKRELLEQIEEIIDRKIGDKVLFDIFAGTCGVGIYLREKYPVYSNDVQIYSKVISEGIIESSPIEISRNQIWQLLEKNFLKNSNYISNKLNKYIIESLAFSSMSKWDEKTLKKYLLFIKKVPSPDNRDHTEQNAKWLCDEYLKQNKKGASFPYIQTTFLFSEMYFSLPQAIEIDSLKYAIDQLSEEYTNLKKILSAALIHAYSYSSAGTGHFAQFRDLSTVSSVTDVFIYRSKSVRDYFHRKTEEIIQASKMNKYHSQSRSFSTDYRELLSDPKIMKKVGLIYADPPYTFVHYSRFYHAIENLCRYDYPIVEHKGRYRMDRHQSPFCIKTQAPSAFREIFNKAQKHRTPVLVSYSNTGMITLDKIEEIAKEEGYKTSLVEIDHRHSTMGRLKDKDRKVKEALLLCY